MNPSFPWRSTFTALLLLTAFVLFRPGASSTAKDEKPPAEAPAALPEVPQFIPDEREPAGSEARPGDPLPKAETEGVGEAEESGEKAFAALPQTEQLGPELTGGGVDLDPFRISLSRSGNTALADSSTGGGAGAVPGGADVALPTPAPSLVVSFAGPGEWMPRSLVRDRCRRRSPWLRVTELSWINLIRRR